jgi:glycosyltransferase involved in cell wall biosynthesis
MYIRNSLSREFSIPLRSEERRREMAGKNVPPRIKIVLMPTVATDERLGLQAIQALERLPNEDRHACIAGTGEYFEKCKEQVAKLGVSDRVTFLPRMPFNQLMEYIASADIGLIIHDGRQSLGNFLSNPMRLSQFAICGVPFVTGNFATLGGDVYRYHLGECCDEMNPEDIARAIRVVGDATGSPEARRGAIRTSYLENLAFEVGAVPFAEAVRALGQGTG